MQNFKHSICIIFSIICSTVYGQSTDKKELMNKAVYNKLEFFINIQATDSIYNLANSDFKSKIAKSDFYNLLETKIYPLGRIKNSEFVSFQNGLNVYNVSFTNNVLAEVPIGVDSTLHFHTLAFIPKEAPKTVQVEEKKEPVLTNTKVIDPQDYIVDSIAQSFVKNKNAQSLSIAVVNNDKVKTFFYGETQKGNKILPTENTLYEIGSISKVFTATLLANLIEEGSATLDQKISLFLPDSLKKNSFLDSITLVQLANHTSGLPRMPSNFDKIKGYDPLDPYKGYKKSELYSYLLNYKNTDKKPGEQYEYSNLGYALLGNILTNFYQKTYDQALQEFICKPLGMTATKEILDPKTKLTLHVYNEGNEVKPWNLNSFGPAGGITSNLSDLVKFCQQQFVMPQNQLQNAMADTRQFTYFLEPDTDVGLAWHMNMFDDLIVNWHNGATGGSSSFIGMSIDKKTAVIVLSNSSLSVDDTAREILKAILK